MYFVIFMIYLADIISGLKSTILIVWGVVIGSLIILSVHIMIEEEIQTILNIFKKIKKYIFSLVIVSIIIALLPSKVVTYAIAGVYMGNLIMSNDKVNHLTEKFYNIIDQKLRSYFDEIDE